MGFFIIGMMQTVEQYEKEGIGEKIKLLIFMVATCFFFLAAVLCIGQVVFGVFALLTCMMLVFGLFSYVRLHYVYTILKLKFNK